MGYFQCKHSLRDSQMQDITDSSMETGREGSLERASTLSDASEAKFLSHPKMESHHEPLNDDLHIIMVKVYCFESILQSPFL